MNPADRDPGHDSDELRPPGDLAYSEEGVDLTVIRWMLSLTPAQRLETLQNHVRSVLRIRDDNHSS